MRDKESFFMKLWAIMKWKREIKKKLQAESRTCKNKIGWTSNWKKNKKLARGEWDGEKRNRWKTRQDILLM